jgi:hypothetical protein
VFNDETPFFLSYPRSVTLPTGQGDNRPDFHYAHQFFEALCAVMAQLVYLPIGCDRGFMDTEGLPGGMNWPEELIRALGSCQVLVGLLSMPYLKSDWCGREWHAFALRHKESAAGASPNQGCIIPVRWTPLVGPPPTVLSDHVNVFEPKDVLRIPNLRQRYNAVGIFRLMQEGEEEAVGEIVWQLARKIQETYYSQRLEPRRFTPGDLVNVFREEER